jgi:hypothetical protein
MVTLSLAFAGLVMLRLVVTPGTRLVIRDGQQHPEQRQGAEEARDDATGADRGDGAREGIEPVAIHPLAFHHITSQGSLAPWHTYPILIISMVRRYAVGVYPKSYFAESRVIHRL